MAGIEQRNRALLRGTGDRVTGTPAFVINGVPVIGAQPTAVLEKTIEPAAAEAGS